MLSMQSRSSWSTMYIGLSGGLGQIYEILFILLSRFLGKEIFLHHHSFAYLNKPSLITKLLTVAGGKSAKHIVLCNKMECLLKTTYPAVQNIYVFSNAALLEFEGQSIISKSKLETIGYLSNISEEKGIFYYLDVMEALIAQNVQVRGYIAGPFQDEKVKDRVMDRISNLPMVHYVGSKYDKEKTHVF